MFLIFLVFVYFCVFCIWRVCVFLKKKEIVFLSLFKSNLQQTKNIHFPWDYLHQTLFKNFPYHNDQHIFCHQQTRYRLCLYFGRHALREQYFVWLFRAQLWNNFLLLKYGSRRHHKKNPDSCSVGPVPLHWCWQYLHGWWRAPPRNQFQICQVCYQPKTLIQPGPWIKTEWILDFLYIR